MDQDRTNWGARQYAEALNNAVATTDLFELANEVNEKWAAAGDLGVRVLSSETADGGDLRRRHQ